MELGFANMQFVWNVMIRTNGNTTEVLRTRMCIVQMPRNTRSAIKDYFISRRHERCGSVVKHFVTVKLWKVKSQVA